MSRKPNRPRCVGDTWQIVPPATCFQVTWAHLTIGVLAGLQTLAFSQKVQIPAMFVDSNSALVTWFPTFVVNLLWLSASCASFPFVTLLSPGVKVVFDRTNLILRSETTSVIVA